MLGVGLRTGLRTDEWKGCREAFQGWTQSPSLAMFEPLGVLRSLCWGEGAILDIPCVLSRLRLFAALWTVVHPGSLPMEFPGKDTEAGCHFLLQGILPTQGWHQRLWHLLHWQAGCLPMEPPGKVLLCLVTQSCLTLCNPVDCSPPGCSVHGDSPGKNTGLGCHALLQGIFPTQGSNRGLPSCRQILYRLNHQESQPGTTP